MPSLYTFTDYSPDWPLAFEQAANQLRSHLGDDLVAIHHIGSTSVPGLAAKPIIDLLPVARSITAIKAKTPQLEAAGYRAWGEYGLPGRWYFTRDEDGYRTHNIHIYGQGDPDIERHLAFRDYLRNHPKVRDEYAAVKRAAYAQHPADIGGYSDHKHGWIQTVEAQALAWYRQSI
ncbi:GrpB family protein [Nodosilinea sp. PGN35]|uniref:GrpB family protein n=1 Tax=Nodosilinea sp. PGN35 TaxID=3020489 RepID=UPI0023B33961|nr:GrpB family protein [Nodosilinea sp. TSF1-S3]MDF0369724.1 GrpB family protein [Nodosilinea sp. TSF1-S3]